MNQLVSTEWLEKNIGMNPMKNLKKRTWPTG